VIAAGLQPRGSLRFEELAARLDIAGDAGREKLFGVEVPLRICPLGAHIDHQDGVVTGMAVDRSLLMAAVPSDGPLVRVESLGFDGAVTANVTEDPCGPVGHWGDYLRAALSALRPDARLAAGFCAVIDGELAGSGLSSSAAVLCAYLAALARVNSMELTDERVIELVQLAENAYIGVASGRLDQSVMVHAEPGSLTRIDCRSLEVNQIPAPIGAEPVAVIVAFSGAGRSLAGSGYNARVLECREAARNLLEMSEGRPAEGARLRDVAPQVFDRYGHRLPRNQRLRATHFFSEMDRVDRGAEAWRRGRRALFGRLVTASGESSIVNYECGTPPLTALFELLRTEEGVLGSRFSGGGFGGTCIALAVPEACEQIISSVSARYAEKHPELASSAAFEVCSPAGPMRIIESGF
jgi:galactokinase/galacturonokinase